MWFSSLSCGRCCGQEQDFTEVSVDKIVVERESLFPDEHPNLLSSLPKAAAGLEAKGLKEEAKKPPKNDVEEKAAEGTGKPEIQFSLRLVRENPKEEKFGVETINTRRPVGLEVRKVKENGLIARWNMEHPEKEVRVGDIITCVNKADCSEVMYTAIFSDLELDVTVLRKEESAA